jgi:hypothetical protein
MSLLYQIESCLRTTRVPASRFGRDAVRDPRIVHDLRRGRQPGPGMEQRLRAHLATVLHAHAARSLDSAAAGKGREGRK